MATNIFLPVTKVPVDQLLNGDFEYPSGISHAIVVEKLDGKQKIVQYCSEDYHLLENSFIIPKFEEEFSKFFNFERKDRIRDYSKFYIDFILKDKKFGVMEKDDIFPKVRVINSYDSSMRFKYQVGFHRLVCTNGLSIPIDDFKELKFLHTPALGKEESFEEVMKMTSEFLAESSDIAEIYYELSDTKVKNWEYRLEEVIEETDFPVTLFDEAKFILEKELSQLKPKNGVNDWLVYNSLNYILNHSDSFMAKQDKKDKIDQEILSYLINY